MIHDEAMWHAEAGEDVDEEEFADIRRGDRQHQLRFHPSREVVNGDDEEPSSLGCLEGSQNVHPPLLEGPWGSNGAHLDWGRPLKIGEPLALITFAYILLGIVKGLRVIIPL